jgi:pyrroloquinoline-quinone synthase
MPTTVAAASTLAAPPAPPIPPLDRPLSATDLADCLRAFHRSYYAIHPFHRRMDEGTLSKAQLQGWVANRLAYQRAIPRKDAAIIANCPDPVVRRAWLTRIVDHDGAEPGTGGIERWIQLGEALGVPRSEMEDERHVLPGVRMAAESYVNYCRSHWWVQGVASSLTELFAPALMSERLAAFPKHYGWVDPRGLEYFRSRLVQAPLDSAQGLAIVTTHCKTTEAQQLAFAALAFKIEMLWVMIETIYHAYPD